MDTLVYPQPVALARVVIFPAPFVHRFATMLDAMYRGQEIPMAIDLLSLVSPGSEPDTYILPADRVAEMLQALDAASASSAGVARDPLAQFCGCWYIERGPEVSVGVPNLIGIAVAAGVVAADTPEWWAALGKFLDEVSELPCTVGGFRVSRAPMIDRVPQYIVDALPGSPLAASATSMKGSEL